MIRVGIIGAKAYTAGEALRWLAGHPEAEIACLMARVEKPEPIGRYFPALRGLVAAPIEPLDLSALARRCDAVILSLPHTTAQDYAKPLVQAGVKVVDLSADFRFDDVATFEATYGVKHLAPELNAKFPYALPELFGGEIPGAAGLACPGCYPTTTLLGLAPLMKRGAEFDLDRIVVNAMSGVSGAGRKTEEQYLFVECNESATAYGVGKHRHRPEIEEKLARLAGRKIKITFTPHLVPMNRGILATSTIPLLKPTTAEAIHAIYRDFYSGRPFVRLLEMGQIPSTGAVAFTNFCDVGLTLDAYSNVLIVVSATDNLAKGAASQAIQAMNILFGLPETLGLLPDSASKSAVS